MNQWENNKNIYIITKNNVWRKVMNQNLLYMEPEIHGLYYFSNKMRMTPWILPVPLRERLDIHGEEEVTNTKESSCWEKQNLLRTQI